MLEIQRSEQELAKRQYTLDSLQYYGGQKIK